MKIFNLSLKELLKNKLYFSYFALGLALLLAVVCVLANYSRQVFDGFFTQFDNGQVLPLKMKEPPRESRYYDELPIFAEGSGITYNVTVSHGEKSVYLPSYRGGMCVVSMGENFIPKEMVLITWHGFKTEFEKGFVYLSSELADELGCVRGDMINIASSEYEVGEIILISADTYSFFIYDPETDAEKFTVILSNKDQLLDVAEHLNSRNFNDTEGLLALCEGYRAMRTAMDIVLVLLSAVCVSFIFVYIKMYFSKRVEFLKILFGMGIRKIRLFWCMGAVFAFLSLIGSAVGLLISELLDILVDNWAQELIGMCVDKVNYLAYFSVGFAACVIVAAVSLTIHILSASESEAKNR